MTNRLLLTMLFLLLSCSAALGVPAAPEELEIEQSDGSKFKARIHGDEFQSWVEAVASGHTVLRNKESGQWEYAEKEPDGTVKGSGMKVDPTGRHAPEFLQKGVRPERDRERELQQGERLRNLLQNRLAPSFSGGSATAGSGSYLPSAAPGDWTPVPVSGTRSVLVVLVNFADRTLTTSADSWYGKIFDTTPGVKSVANFFRQNSFGKLSVVPAFSGGSHPGVVTVTVPDRHPNCGQNITYLSETTILSHALAQAAAAVDLSAFDPDSGEVYFVYAGYEASGSQKLPNIWAHAWGGSVTGGGVTINRWALNGELNNGDLQHPIGVMTHELGHSLCGLPDLYDTSYYNAGLGIFSLMASGSWGRTIGQWGGSTPVALDAWSREYLGWSAPVVPTANGEVSLAAALASENNAVKLINPLNSSSEYWLAENRFPTPGGWDEGITGLASGYSGGVLITHIDITAGTQGVNDINRYLSGLPQGVVPVQGNTSICNMLAGGAANSCRGTAVTTYYSGNNSDFSNGTAPNSNYYSGAPSNRGITAISARGENMTAHVMVTVTPDTTKPLVTAFTLPAAATTLAVPVTSFSASDNAGVTGYLLTESSTIPLLSHPGWRAAAPASYTFATTGSKRLYAWARDSAGNISLARTAAVLIDNTPPVVSAVVVPPYYNSRTVPVTVSATDNVKVAGYLVTTTSSAPAATDPNWKSSATLSITFSAAGANSCYAWARDTAGNVSLSRTATLFIETAAPAVQSFSVDPLVAGVVIPIRAFSASDSGGSGIGGYRITETATAPLAAAAGWSATPPLSHSTATGGQKTLYAWVKDRAGNISQAVSATVYADASKPVVTAFTAPATSASLTIPVTCAASDNLAVAGYLVNESSAAPLPSNAGWRAASPVSYSFLSTGSKMLYAWARDTAGNVSLARTVAVLIDNTAPLVSAVAAPPYYNSQTVPVTVTATDNARVGGYLVTTTSAAPAANNPGWKSSATLSITFSAPGSNSCYAWAKDSTGNVSLSKSATVFIETAAPTVGGFAVDTLVAGRVIPIRAFSASDSGGSGIGGYRVTESATAPLAAAAGWSATAPVSYTTATGGQKTLYAWVKDRAGNVSPAVTATLYADAIKPVVTAFTAPATSASLTIPITCAASDNLAVAGYLVNESSSAPLPSNAGWRAASPVSYSFLSTGSKRLYAWALDTAGNVSLARTVAVLIDNTAPLVSAVAAPSYYNSQVVPVTVTATDNSGVGGYLVTTTSAAPAATNPNWKSSATFSITFSAPGSNTCYAWAKDATGNVSLSRSATVFIETAAPTIGSFSVDPLVAGAVIPIRAFSAGDTGGSGIAGYRITESATAPLAAAAGWSATAPVSYSTATGGQKTLYAWVKDRAGNVSRAVTATVYADTVKPVVTAFSLPSTSTRTIIITSYLASDNIAVAGYLLTESSSAPSPSHAGWSSSPPTTYTFATIGSKRLYAWVRDRAGNVSLPKYLSTVIN